MNKLKECTTALRLSGELKSLLIFYSKQFRVTQSEFIRDSIINQIDNLRNKTILK